MSIKDEWVKYYPNVVSPGKELDTEEDIKTFSSFFRNVVHSVPPRSPLFAYHGSRGIAHGLQSASAKMCIPGSKGVEYRHYMGGLYLTLLIVRDEEERRKREVEFQKRMAFWFDNFEELWEKGKVELLKGAQEIRSFDFENATPLGLIEWIYSAYTKYLQMWDYHMEYMYPSFSAFLVFSDFMNEHFGISRTDPQFQKLLTGFDNRLYQINETLSGFGKRAKKDGLEYIFKENPAEDILTKLQETPKGKKFAEDFMNFLEVDGWWPTTLCEFNCSYWLEQPSIPLSIIKNNIEKNIEFDLREMREKAVKEREESLKRFALQIPESEKEYFWKLSTLAAKCSSYQEEHAIYTEYAYHTAIRYGYLRIAEKLVKAGSIEQKDDIFFLIPPEIEIAMINPDRIGLDHIVKARRAIYEEWLKSPIQLIFTARDSVDEAFEKDLVYSYDPIMISCVVGEQPVIRKELKADLYGICGSPGEVEGVVRVVQTYKDMDQVQKGDILVTTTTDPNWTPVFPLIKGIITQQGGVLSHSSITAREFGIPAVVGAQGALEKIKTGQKVRIIADQGIVYIL